MTPLVPIDPLAIDAAAITAAAERLRGGGLVAFPTETVYGLGVNALDREAVRRLFAAKGRPSTDPLIVHVSSLEGARPLITDLPDTARSLADRFWPGPLTLVLRRSRLVPDEVTAGLDTVAVRVPAHPVARALIDAAGIPVAAPSANLFSRPSPTRADHVLEDLDGRIDLVLDGGPTQVGVESTVLDLSGAVPSVLRPGAVTMEMLAPLLPGLPMRGAGATPPGAPMRSPGMLDRHYSPRAPLTLYTGAESLARLIQDAGAALRGGARLGLMLTSEDVEAVSAVNATVSDLGPSGDTTAIAARLYAALRELDRSGVDLILVRGIGSPGGGGIDAAIDDRLRRAAAGRIVSTCG